MGMPKPMQRNTGINELQGLSTNQPPKAFREDPVGTSKPKKGVQKTGLAVPGMGFGRIILQSLVKYFVMGNLLYVIVVILIIGWLLGMFAFNVTGGLIHALLVIAVILIIIKLVSGRRV